MTSPHDAAPLSIVEEIREAAAELGFDATGFTTPDAIPQAAPRLKHFLDAGRHGDMDWMARTSDRRGHPAALWPDVRSVIMVGHAYTPDSDPMAALTQRDRGAVSVYAKGKDYHDVIKTKLKQLARSVATLTAADVKVFVDTAPLMEKPLAAAAGIGWQGKHTNLVSREHGSWLFLGAILTAARLPADEPEIDHCGSCRRCLDVCPTDAFPAPYQLDARRCIAYLTIEHAGHIPREFRRAIGNRIFGCDDCLAVCPWNKFASIAREARYAARLETDNPPLDVLLDLDDAAFRKRFAGTPIKRTGRDRFLRNVLIAAGNSGDPALVPKCLGLLGDPSPLVRGMAVWALRQLTTEEHFAAYRSKNLRRERDQHVRSEWIAATTNAEPGNLKAS
ncbi:MAG: tRNA epoxyqueuosine(34) reductase QueG [Pseudomonadota bacterium]